MKRLLLVLMLLCVFMPVNAKGGGMPPLIYNLKSADTGMDSNDGGNSWEQYKENHTGYIIVEANDNNTANIWPIDTWTAKDANGKTQKYCEQQDMKTFGFLQGLVGKNTVWIITYADDVNGGQSIMLSGTVKPVKIATPLGPATLPLASALTGTEMWLDEEEEYDYLDICSGKLSLSYNSTLTTYTYNHGIDTGEAATAYVVNYLEKTLHYQGGTEN
jgi:hypothetical protein